MGANEEQSPDCYGESKRRASGARGGLHPRLLPQARNVFTAEQTPGLIPELTISVTPALLLEGSPLLKWFKFRIFSQLDLEKTGLE